MSNYHYGDQSGCKGDCTRESTYQVGNMVHDNCTAECICRQNGDRSPWDKMVYEQQMKGTPIKLENNKVLAMWPGYKQ